MNALIHTLAALSPITPGDLPQTGATRSSINNIRSVLFPIIGAIALLVIVISGLRYILAGGDAQKISKAKNGVIYALVGLSIAIISGAVVSFVVKRI
jgi:hypothetical protein